MIPVIHSQTIDRLIHAQLGQLTAGLSPAALMQAFSDWQMHLLISPGKRV